MQLRTAKATIYDVARQAGVNPSTVSRALNNPERVNAHTRRLVEATAIELDFQLNHAAQVLQTGSTKTLGLIVSDVTNPTFFGILRDAGRVAAQRNYTVVLVNAAESATTELASANRLIKAVDGLILTSPRMNDTDIQILARTKQIVVINREVNGVNSVIPDPDKGVSQAVRFLAGNGHKKVLFVAGPELSWMSARRWDAILAACQWCHLAAERIESATPTMDGGRRVAKDVKASGATAVITYNDLLAIGLMRELQDKGIVIPDTLSIIGFDDIFGADFTTPSLASIRSPLGQCGSLSADLILDSLAGSVKDSQTLLVDTALVMRGSAAPWKGV